MAKAPAKNAKKRKKRNRFKIVVVLFCLILAISLALAGAIAYLRRHSTPVENESLSRFAIQTITVSGNTKYDDAAIIGESGLKVGQSIFSVNKGAAAKKIEELFPYVRDASVKNVTYNTLCIEIKEAENMGAMYHAGNWLVVGTNGTGLDHPDWEKNLALGLKLHTQCERIAPGIMRYVNLRAQRFNQDLSSGALIVEVGAAGNTHAEAMTAIEVLADGILSLANGSAVP